MKKKGLSCIIIGILLITIIPIENEQAIPATKTLTGDISLELIEPIQVIEDADTLVTNKAITNSWFQWFFERFPLLAIFFN